MLRPSQITYRSWNPSCANVAEGTKVDHVACGGSGGVLPISLTPGRRMAG